MPVDKSEDIDHYTAVLETNDYPVPDAFHALATSLHIHGGLAPSQARAYALRHLRTPGPTEADLAKYAELTRGSLAKSHSDATKTIDDAQTLAALTRDDHPTELVHEFDITTAPEPHVDRSYDHVTITRYLARTPHDNPRLQYAVHRDHYVTPTEDAFPTDTTNHLYNGTTVNRYTSEQELLDDQYYTADFHTPKHRRDLYQKLTTAGFTFESQHRQSLTVGDTVTYVGDPGNDDVLINLDDETGTITRLPDDNPDEVYVQFADDLTIHGLAHDFKPVSDETVEENPLERHRRECNDPNIGAYYAENTETEEIGGIKCHTCGWKPPGNDDSDADA